MKKIILIIILVAMLFGCTSKPDDMKYMIEQAIKVGESVVAFKHPNYHKPTYSYYLPSNVGVIESNDNSSLLRYRNNEIVMNLNVAAIITEKYYKNSATPHGNLNIDYFFQYQGGFRDFENKHIQYNLEIFNLMGPEYYLVIETKYANYFVSAPLGELQEIVPILLTIAKTVAVDEDKVVQLYSRKIELKDSKVTRLPSKTEGYLFEMIKDYEYEFKWEDYVDDAKVEEDIENNEEDIENNEEESEIVENNEN